MVQNPRQRYKSSLWYYDILKFVAEQNETNTLDEERDVKNALVNPTDLSQEEIMVRLGTIFFKNRDSLIFLFLLQILFLSVYLFPLFSTLRKLLNKFIRLYLILKDMKFLINSLTRKKKYLHFIIS